MKGGRTMSNLVPFRSMLHTLNRWPSILDDDDFQFLNGPANNGIDLYETKDEVVVKANVAGVASDNIDITFEKGVLWIQADSIQEEDDKENKYYSKSSWNYSYKISVPGMLDHSVDPDVELNGGVLSFVFKKSQATMPKKLII